MRHYIGVMNRIRDIREERKLTQEELAERAGLPRQHVSDLERGVMRPRIDTAQKLAAALGVTVDDLFPADLPAAANGA